MAAASEPLDKYLGHLSPTKRTEFKAHMARDPEIRSDVLGAIDYEITHKEKFIPETHCPVKHPLLSMCKRPAYFQALTNFFIEDFEQIIYESVSRVMKEQGCRERVYTFRERIVRYLVLLQSGSFDRAWDMFGGDGSTFYKDINTVGECLHLALYDTLVSAPSPDSEEYRLMRSSYCFRWFANLIYAVDGTYIPTKKPGSREVQRRYYDMKHHCTAFSCLAIVDSLGFFRYVFGPKPGGSWPDATMWYRCGFVQKWNEYIAPGDKLITDAAWTDVRLHKDDLIYPVLNKKFYTEEELSAIPEDTMRQM